MRGTQFGEHYDELSARRTVFERWFPQHEARAFGISGGVKSQKSKAAVPRRKERCSPQRRRLTHWLKAAARIFNR